jgi:hypothetical protein
VTKTFDEVADALALGTHITDGAGRPAEATGQIGEAADPYARARAAVEQTRLLVADSLEKTRRNVQALGLETLTANDSVFDESFVLLRDLLAAKSLVDALELHTASVRHRWESALRLAAAGPPPGES